MSDLIEIFMAKPMWYRQGLLSAVQKKDYFELIKEVEDAHIAAFDMGWMVGAALIANHDTWLNVR